LRDGRTVGYLTSAGFGYTVGTPIGLGYVRGAADLRDGSYELVVAQQRVPAEIHVKPLYDPANAKVKA
jgi:4-methylaminobutanoate oxidase (formaldehyde-forming)